MTMEPLTISNPPPSDDTELKNSGRRELLKALAAGGAMALSGLLPNQWVKPAIEVGVLPAHAQASPLPTDTATPTGTLSSTPTATSSPTSTATATSTRGPNVYSLRCAADSQGSNITATVLATNNAPVGNIQVQYIAQSIPAAASTSPVAGSTNNSGVVNLGNFEFCQSTIREYSNYQIVISFVDTTTYGNATCTLGPYTGAC